MRFKVERTSRSDEMSPCPEAKKLNYIRIDERFVDDPNIYGETKESWLSKGSNHRIENGHIKRDFRETGWFIEINLLEELVEFEDNYGPLVINKSWENPGILEIEIYDTYRE